MSGQADALNALRGAQNRAAGKYFEEAIDAACRYYRLRGLADIDKTPEPMRPTQSLGKGRYIAFYEKKAQPDFKGTLAGGRSIVFEAKFTATNKMKQEAVLPQQVEALDRHARLGAVCFILVAFGLNDCYRVPWEAWKDMKDRYGRKYVTPDDLQEYKVRRRQGILQFLAME